MSILQAGRKEKKNKRTYHEIQNEIIKMLTLDILKQIVLNLKDAILFPVIVDETLDIKQE